MAGCAGLVLAGCGSDPQADSAPAPVAIADGEPGAPAPTTTEVTVRTTVPLVSVPDAARDAPVPTGDQRLPTITAADVGPTPSPPVANPATTAPPTPAPPSPASSSTLAPGLIDDLEDFIATVPTVAPAEGEGTAIRATIEPVDGLAVGDVVTIEASNLPPGQWMAWGQCSEQGIDSVDFDVLLAACGGFGFDLSATDGTASVEVRVLAGVGGVDCAVDDCYIGIVVFPGTDDYRRYEPISLAG